MCAKHARGLIRFERGFLPIGRQADHPAPRERGKRIENPEGVVQKFHLMVGGPGIVQPFSGALDMLGLTDDGVGELFRKYPDRLHDADRENGEKGGSDLWIPVRVASLPYGSHALSIPRYNLLAPCFDVCVP